MSSNSNTAKILWGALLIFASIGIGDQFQNAALRNVFMHWLPCLGLIIVVAGLIRFINSVDV